MLVYLIVGAFALLAILAVVAASKGWLPMFANLGTVFGLAGILASTIVALQTLQLGADLAAANALADLDDRWQSVASNFERDPVLLEYFSEAQSEGDTDVATRSVSINRRLISIYLLAFQYRNLDILNEARWQQKCMAINDMFTYPIFSKYWDAHKKYWFDPEFKVAMESCRTSPPQPFE